jgi:hypothetical protein
MLVLASAGLMDGTGREAVDSASASIEDGRISAGGTDPHHTDPHYGESSTALDLDGFGSTPSME